MCAGVMTYELVSVADKLSDWQVSVLEACSLAYCGYILDQGFCIEDFKVLILFPILISCAETRKGIVSRALDNRLSALAGGISYEIFLNHLLFTTALTMWWHELSYGTALLICILCSISLAVVMHAVIQLTTESLAGKRTLLKRE